MDFSIKIPFLNFMVARKCSSTFYTIVVEIFTMGMISYKYKNSRTVNATEIFNVAFKNAFENAAKLETFIPDLPSKIFDWLPVPVQRSPIIESRKRIGHFYAQVNSRSIHVLFCATAATF